MTGLTRLGELSPPIRQAIGGSFQSCAWCLWIQTKQGKIGNDKVEIYMEGYLRVADAAVDEIMQEPAWVEFVQTELQHRRPANLVWNGCCRVKANQTRTIIRECSGKLHCQVWT